MSFCAKATEWAVPEIKIVLSLFSQKSRTSNSEMRIIAPLTALKQNKSVNVTRTIRDKWQRMTHLILAILAPLLPMTFPMSSLGTTIFLNCWGSRSPKETAAGNQEKCICKDYVIGLTLNVIVTSAIRRSTGNYSLQFKDILVLPLQFIKVINYISCKQTMGPF